MLFELRYPHLAAWIQEQGWLHIGRDEFLPSFIRVLDGGGMVWEGASDYPTIDDALAAAEEGLVIWMREHGFQVSG